MELNYSVKPSVTTIILHFWDLYWIKLIVKVMPLCLVRTHTALSPNKVWNLFCLQFVVVYLVSWSFHTCMWINIQQQTQGDHADFWVPFLCGSLYHLPDIPTVSTPDTLISILLFVCLFPKHASRHRVAMFVGPVSAVTLFSGAKVCCPLMSIWKTVVAYIVQLSSCFSARGQEGNWATN